MTSFISVRDYGTAGDGCVDDAPAIQRALEAGAPEVRIPAGTYRVEQPLLIGSDTTLRLDGNAVILLGEGVGPRHGARGFLATNRDSVSGNCNITVDGGIWDGNNPANTRGPDGLSDSYTGAAINFVNVRSLNLRNLTVRDPESFFIRLGEVCEFVVEDITLESRHIRPNQDGVHVGGFCQDGTIRCIRGLGVSCPNDDMVALNSNDDVTRAVNLGMKEGPIRRIRVKDIAAEDAYTFVRILSQDAIIEDIDIQKIRGGCRYHALNLNRWRFPPGKGCIRRVRIGDVEVVRSPSKSNYSRALIDVNLAVQDLEIRDFRRPEDDHPEIASLAVGNGSYTALLEGLNSRQRRALKFASTDSFACEDAGKAFKSSSLKAVLTPKDCLCLPSGGFKRLSLSGPDNQAKAEDRGHENKKDQI